MNLVSTETLGNCFKIVWFKKIVWFQEISAQEKKDHRTAHKDFGFMCGPYVKDSIAV